MQQGIPIPREHGAWAVLYGPFLIGAGSAGRLDAEILIFWVAVTAFFLARHPLSRLARLGAAGPIDADKFSYWMRWFVIYLVAGLAATVPLLFYYKLWYLLPLGGASALVLLAHLYLSTKRAERRLLGEFLGVAGLTLTAPGAYYVLQARADDVALFLWFWNLLYFTSGIFYVKMRVGCFARKPDSHLLLWQCALYHLLLLCLIVSWVWWGRVSQLFLLAFLPIVVRAFAGMLVRQRGLNLKRIGYMEIGFTVIFVIAMVWASR
jgi:hypothetical protein